MRIQKRYGSYQRPECPFCPSQATTKSKEGVPVCTEHKGEKLPDLKCSCGEYVDLKDGKWGPYFSCMKCGNVRFSRIMEVNDVRPSDKKKPKKEFKPGVTTVSSDELDFLY